MLTAFLVVTPTKSKKVMAASYYDAACHEVSNVTMASLYPGDDINVRRAVWHTQEGLLAGVVILLDSTLYVPDH